MKRILCAVIMLASGLRAGAGEPLALPPLFGDHMVLQRDRPVPVWGTAEPGTGVTVSFAGETATATAGPDGAWLVRLPALPASSEPRVLTVETSPSGRKLEIADVVVGDVYLCAGQSNMEMWLGHGPDAKAADFPLIRHSRHGEAWSVCTPATVSRFSAVGFYFARRVHEETGIPIGLLNNAVGGSNIERWISPAGLELVPELKAQDEQWNRSFLEKLTADNGKRMTELADWITTSRPVLQGAADERQKDFCLKALDALERWLAEVKVAMAAGRRLPPMAPVPYKGHYPLLPEPPESWKGLHNLRFYGNLHEPYVEPLIPYAFRAMLWYQGESNGGECDSYVRKMTALVGGMRQRWGQGEFPVLMVQLPGIGADDNNPASRGGLTRFGQLKSLAIPHTGLAVSIDLAHDGNLHPPAPVKADQGERIARWALATIYDRNIPYSGPLYKGMKIDGASVRISFDHAESGLMVGQREGNNPAVVTEVVGGKLKSFVMAEGDPLKPAAWKWVWADAVIDGNAVVISSPGILHPVAAGYAVTSNPAEPNLYNRAGLPASPFRTDLF